MIQIQPAPFFLTSLWLLINRQARIGKIPDNGVITSIRTQQ
jgi:hypothetical protein